MAADGTNTIGLRAPDSGLRVCVWASGVQKKRRRGYPQHLVVAGARSPEPVYDPPAFRGVVDFRAAPLVWPPA
jgi:hypothetical protein